MRNNDSQLAGNPGKKNIRFRSGMVPGLPSGDAHIGFEVVNGTFHNSPYFIEGNPFIRIPLDTGKHTEVHVFVSIGGTPLFGGAARFRAVAYPLAVYHADFGADPFVTVRTAFFMAVSGVFHVQCAVFGAGGIAVSIIPDFFKGTFIPWVIRDQCPGEMEFIPEEAVSFDRVKKRNHPGRYQDGNPGGAKRDQRGPVSGKKNHRWIYLHPGNQISFPQAFAGVKP